MAYRPITDTLRMIGQGVFIDRISQQMAEATLAAEQLGKKAPHETEPRTLIDAATIARMRVFDRFALAIPVFWGRPRYPLAARLRYRIAEGKVRFWYELIRPDRVHEEAAKAEIATIIDLLAERESKARVYMGSM